MGYLVSCITLIHQATFSPSIDQLNIQHILTPISICYVVARNLFAIIPEF